MGEHSAPRVPGDADRPGAPERFGPEPAMSGGEAIVRSLVAHGVREVFGIPGTHNLEIYRHLRRYDIGNVTPRHEQGAGYAADAYARVSGRPGVAITTTGPALLNIAAAVGQAYSDSVPLLVVSPGMPLRHPRLSNGLLHEMRSQTDAMRGVAAFSHRVSSVDEIGAAVARAFALFTSGRPRPAHIEIPLDLLEAAEPVSGIRLTPPAAPAVPPCAEVDRAADALRTARHPAIVLGGGARGAGEECLALAEELGAPVVTTANGKGIVAETHPLSVGVSLHSPAVQKWLADRDAVVAVGTELAESDLWSAPLELNGTLIRIDVDPAQMYAEPAAGHPLVGDARATVGAVIDALRARGGAAATGTGRGGAAAATAAAATAAERSPSVLPSVLPEGDAARTVAALRVARDDETRVRDARWVPYLRAVRRVLAPDAVITSDSAQCCYYGALPHLPVGPEGRYLHPTGFGTLGYALPAAIGAKTACPGRQVVALSGDGGLQFSVQELAIAAQLRLPLPVVVFDNGGYGEIRDEMTARGDTPTAVDLPSVDLPALARAYGGYGERAHSPEELADALTRALTAPGPTLITVPEETPR
ncbi:thiamine pyrophosphate-binding protein [Streptomyces sp. NBC_01020]|uniref:thiamine pyrophosphate-dependent enzyme n=1 Tax=Streptomyces sp. NBC_01020 TaxID=2903722 RepID=UPI00386E1D74|nr:thiamine pyrophosphate-binding protein [Streptomyces sp. NBC_01020]